MSSPTGVAGGHPPTANMADVQDLNLLLIRQEELLKSINDKLPPIGNTLTELRLLEDIQKQLCSGQSKSDFLWSCFLQILGVAFVILFRVFSALAYISAQTANSQSMDANQIALLSLCIGSNSSVTQDICAELLQHVNQFLPSVVSAVVGLPTSTVGGIVPSATIVTSHGLSMAQKVELGLGIGVGIPAFIGLFASSLMYWWNFRRPAEVLR